jgi:3-methyl-2-oxobutanoate hydroxymethyltransferase
MLNFTINDFKKFKTENKKIAMITAYDYPMGMFCESAGMDVILVGDSLGMVELGHEDTTKVTMQDMVSHTAAVRRGAPKTFVVSDMPFLSYGYDIKESVLNAGRLVREGSCNAVKLEGGREMCDTVKAIVKIGIPVVGHIGYTPQSVNMFGKNMVRGKDHETAKNMIENAKALEEAGVCALVMELVPRELAKTVTEMLEIPTIGIGSGAECDGQVLVVNDMFKLFRDFTPKHCKVYYDLGKTITGSLREYIDDVKSQRFPEPQNSFDTDMDMIVKLREEYAENN